MFDANTQDNISVLANLLPSDSAGFWLLDLVTNEFYADASVKKWLNAADIKDFNTFRGLTLGGSPLIVPDSAFFNGRREKYTEAYTVHISGKNPLRINETRSVIMLGGCSALVGIWLNVSENYAEADYGSVMFASNPHMSALMSSNFKMVDASESLLKFFGCDSKADFFERFPQLMEEYTPPFQSSGVPSMRFSDRLSSVIRLGEISFDTELCVNNSKRQTYSCVMKKMPFGDSFVIGIYVSNVENLKQAEREILKKDKLIRAINKIVTNVLNADEDSFEREIVSALRMLCLTISSDRAYICERVNKQGESYLREVFEWAYSPEIGNKKEDYPTIPLSGHPLLSRIVNGKKPYHTASENILGSKSAPVSGLIIPLYYQGDSWGVIGFEHYRGILEFSDAETQMLLSGGSLLISAIMRGAMFKDIVEVNAKLAKQEAMLSAINFACITLFSKNSKDAQNMTNALPDALKTLAAAVNADIIAIWRNRIGDEKLMSDRVISIYRGVTDEYRSTDLICEESFERVLPNWIQDGNPPDINLNMKDLYPAFREVCAERVKNGSVFISPIHLDGEFWGVCSYIFEKENVFFTEIERNILRQTGVLAGAAISLTETQERLIETTERAVKNANAKSDFLSRMSHEIRTPMNAILGMTTLAQKAEDTTKIRYYIDNVNASSKQLLSIINDVLDMSKIEANKLEISSSPFDISKVIENAENITKVKANEKNQRFYVSLDNPFGCEIVSDELRVSQVLVNLLSNAVKFTPQNGEIRLTSSVLKRDDTYFFRAEIADTGIGIAESSLDKIFNSFEQSDGGITRRFGGTGLGLAICKKIADLMDGEISVASSEGMGSVFTFEIPVSLGFPIVETHDYFKDINGMKVLVADDVPDTLAYMQKILIDISANCDTVASYGEAVSAIEENAKAQTPYDVIILDWYLGDKTGGDVIRAVKPFLNGESIVILFSAADYSDIANQTKDLGEINFLRKPVFTEDIYSKIKLILRSRAHKHETEDTPDWSGKTILLAEDIEINREVVSAMLENTGVQFLFAENGAEAVHFVKRHSGKFQLILMDMQMPIMDGITATKAIRAIQNNPAARLPIIAMTANAFKEDITACLEAGMNGHIAKPIELGNIYEVLKQYL
ncbi:hypothetical protein FACS189490_01040 [Clostridia bacterium]|nr:hypothetical protein FACS189490_01040 [Clostridia bacterium]